MTAFIDCFCCEKLNCCSDTNLKRVKDSYCCVLFKAIKTEEYSARVDLYLKFGDSFIESLLADGD